MDKVEKYIKKVITNIEEDREVTNELLKDVMGYIGKDDNGNWVKEESGNTNNHNYV